MNKKLILLLLLLVVINGFIFFIFNSKKELETGFVTRVIDGDTVVINGESIRLLGIDTDEKGDKCYKEAKERLEVLILEKDVLLERGVRDRDQYKRLLRYLHLEKNGEVVNINLLLVEEGLAIARFYENKKYKDEILDAELVARTNKMGCKWQDL